MLCDKEEESVDHLFLQCEAAFRVWSNFIGKCDFSWCCLKSIVDVAESWLGGCFVGCGQILWSMILFSFLWSIWKERNDRIFRGYSLSTIDLISKITFRIAKWALVRKKFSNFTFNDIISS